MADEGAVNAYESGFASATESLRSTAKWLVAVAAGLGSILVAGVQLSDLGRLDVGYRFAFAVVSMVGALVGVGAVAWLAQRVLVANSVSFRELIQSFDSAEREVLSPARIQRLTELRTAIEQEARLLYQEVANREGHQPTEPDVPAVGLVRLWELVGDQARRRLDDAKPFEEAWKTSRVDRSVGRVLTFVAYWETRKEFTTLARWLPAASALVLVSVVSFVLAMAPAPKADDLIETPTAVTVYLTDAGLKDATQQLGCKPTNGLPAVAVGGTMRAPQLVVGPLPSQGCRAGRLNLVAAEVLALVPTQPK